MSIAPIPFFTFGSGNPSSPPSSPRRPSSPTGVNSRSNIPIPRSSELSGLSSPPRSPSRGAPDIFLDDSFKLPSSTLVQTPPLRPQAAPVLAMTPMTSALPSSADMLSLDGIPSFYDPRVKKAPSSVLSEEELLVIDKFFNLIGSARITESSVLVDFVTNTLGLSRYFAEPLFRRLSKTGSIVSRSIFLSYWKSHFVLGDSVSNFFHLVKQDVNDYITRSDLREFLWVHLDSHPGLLFLRDSPEFQERYADTVICRIFYHLDRRHCNKIYLRDLQRATNPSIVKSWLDLDQTDDINTIRQFFSYEHFYVLYCKFWDLDADHDFLIDREDLLKYDGHAFSPRAIDRVFANVGGVEFTSGVPGKMNYDDFVWFILSDEDKTTEVSLSFFFNLIDLDGDGVIRDHEMKFFYEDQVHRLECVNQEAPAFRDIMCQMNDLLKPEREGQFRLGNFFSKKTNSGVFFSILLSLNKFMAYEQRDPFQLKQDLINNPELTDWDRFCLGEYVRLAMEAGNNEQGNMQQSEADYLRNVS